MKLVSVHKLIFYFIMLFAVNKTNAQEVWSLNQCIDTALVYNKSLQINRNNTAIGEQKVNESKANLVPKISANADYKYFTDLPHQLMPLSTFNPTAPEGQFKEAQFGVPHNLNANLLLTMPLYSPQIYGAIQNTKTAIGLSKLQYQKTEEQLRYDITLLYYNAQIVQHQLVFLDSNLLNTNKLLKNMQLLHQQLMAKGIDVSKLKLQIEQLSTQQKIVNNRYQQILNALKLHVGIVLNRELSVESFIPFRETTFTPIQKQSLDEQIINQQNKLLSSELSTLQRSACLPSLNLVASYGTAGFGYDKKPNDFLKFYPIGFAGIQFTYPLFSGTVTHRKIKQKKLEISNNRLQSQLIADKNTIDIENAERQKTTTYQSITDTGNQIKLAQTIYQQTILQQRQGVANITDVLLADHTLREAQQNYLSALIDYLKADLELKKLGGNLE